MGSAPSGAHVVVNDRADIARLAGAAGVHVGQDDLAARGRPRASSARSASSASRRTRSRSWTPPSAHPSTTSRSARCSAPRRRPPDTTRSASRWWSRRRRVRTRTGCRVVAIGGITLERAADVIRAGADSVAVICDLLSDRRSAGARARVSRPVVGGREGYNPRNMANSPVRDESRSAQLLEEMEGENRLRRVLGPVQLTASASARSSAPASSWRRARPRTTSRARR